jgi:glycosyltransferase involved in cell wall biosynthesis
MTGSLLAITPVDAPGGAETTLMRLLAGLRERGWQLAITTPHRGPLADQARAAGFRWHPLPLGGLAPRAGARALASWPAAGRLSRGSEVVYLNGGVCGRVIPALRRRARLVLHIHDMVRQVPRLWRRADVVLAASQAVADRLHGLDGHVVYPPADPNPPAVAAPWSTGNGPVVGFVGRLEPRKGPLDLVRAAPAIRRGVAGTRIVMVGGEPYGVAPDYTREVLQSSAVEHYPWSDNAPGLMRHLDVLVLPSYEEPAGTVLAEAMAVGTPVVATRVNGLPEVVRDGVTGRLVEPGDIDGLAAAVLEVIEHRTSMGQAAREHARRFQTDRYVEQVERLIAP